MRPTLITQNVEYSNLCLKIDLLSLAVQTGCDSPVLSLVDSCISCQPPCGHQGSHHLSFGLLRNHQGSQPQMPTIEKVNEEGKKEEIPFPS